MTAVKKPARCKPWRVFSSSRRKKKRAMLEISRLFADNLVIPILKEADP